jgi:hypothetical protein
MMDKAAYDAVNTDAAAFTDKALLLAEAKSDYLRALKNYLESSGQMRGYWIGRTLELRERVEELKA